MPAAYFFCFRVIKHPHKQNSVRCRCTSGVRRRWKHFDLSRSLLQLQDLMLNNSGWRERKKRGHTGKNRRPRFFSSRMCLYFFYSCFKRTLLFTEVMRQLFIMNAMPTYHKLTWLQWRIQKFWKGEGRKTIYQSRHHLLQMHTTNYIRKKAAFWKYSEPIGRGGRPPPLNPPLPGFKYALYMHPLLWHGR